MFTDDHIFAELVKLAVFIFLATCLFNTFAGRATICVLLEAVRAIEVATKRLTGNLIATRIAGGIIAITEHTVIFALGTIGSRLTTACLTTLCVRFITELAIQVTGDRLARLILFALARLTPLCVGLVFEATTTIGLLLA